ncbi:hypothetical protein D3C76_353710 [compost metagenome]
MRSIKRHHTRITSLDNYNLPRKMMELRIMWHPKVMMKQDSLEQVPTQVAIRIYLHETYLVRYQLVRILTITIFFICMMRLDGIS